MTNAPARPRTARQEAVEWMARKLRLSTNRKDAFSWWISGDVQDEGLVPARIAGYLNGLYEGEGTLAQMKRFKADAFAEAERWS